MEHSEKQQEEQQEEQQQMEEVQVEKANPLNNYIVLQTIFSYLDLNDLRRCAQVCQTWDECLQDENTAIWRFHCKRFLSKETICSDYLSSVTSYKAKLRAYFHAWNPDDISNNMDILPNAFTLRCCSIVESTDGARGTIGFSQGRHVWEIMWEGAEPVVGISTIRAPIQCYGYRELVGSTNESWGWNLVTNQRLHCGRKYGRYPLHFSTIPFVMGERIRIILDCDEHTLSFGKDHEYYGIAFTHLPNETLYPMISTVDDNTEVSLIYLGNPYN